MALKKLFNGTNMKINNAVMIGFGVVGKATSEALGIEKYLDIKKSNISFDDAVREKYIFICLPTPTINGKCFTQDIEYIIKKISYKKSPDTVIILRSTVIPGTTRKLSQKYKINIIHHPEFLTEATALQDSKHPDLLVFGSDNKKILADFVKIYDGFECPKFKMDSITSETLKYAINNFYALKVVFANQIYDLCQANGANYHLLKEAMYARKWIGQNHLDVFHKGYRGAGGNCLPKDLEAFVFYSKLPLLKTALKINKQYLSKK